MKIISLRDFALTGSFNQVTIGSSIGELIEVFGNPDHTHKTEDSVISYYGVYEFHFLNSTKKIFLIQCVRPGNEQIHFQNKTIKVDPWFFKTDKNFTFKEVIVILDAEKVKYNVNKDNDSIEFESGVYFDFIEGYSGFGGVNENVGKWKSFDVKIEKEENYILRGIRKETI